MFERVPNKGAVKHFGVLLIEGIPNRDALNAAMFEGGPNRGTAKQCGVLLIVASQRGSGSSVAGLAQVCTCAQLRFAFFHSAFWFALRCPCAMERGRPCGARPRRACPVR
eukprot:5319260-Pyramimonas_sp.AAC.1